ncbi:hypothetical protein EG329_000353 [Mollisiaceae sp. DMI_Dod_QoI]|nr:hypothetical protein EG329_000353 [Helotiales sp. DMI_Dod_QoI]
MPPPSEQEDMPPNTETQDQDLISQFNSILNLQSQPSSEATTQDNMSAPKRENESANPSSDQNPKKRKREQPFMSAEELELAMLETILEAAWNYRVALIPSATSAAQRRQIRQDERTTCLIAAQGLRFSASRKYYRAREILLEAEDELAEFEERKGWA